MIPTTPNGADPSLTDRRIDPAGVIRKNLPKIIVAAFLALLLVSMTIASLKKKPAMATDKSRATEELPNTTANNQQTLHRQVAAEREDLKQAGPDPIVGIPAQQGTALAYGPTGVPLAATCLPGQPCAPAGYAQGGQQAQSPEQQEAQQLAVKERERLYTSRFASNIAYSHSEQQASAQQQTTLAAAPGRPTNLTPARAAGEQPTYKRSEEVNIDSASGQPYVIYEGLTLDTVLMNRLDGDAAGPVKVLVSNPVYSHDHQHVLIPEGTIVLGEARKIGATGFGQQRRVAVVFHRMLMPDGYSVDLDQFHGLDQIGEEGLKDKVNNHYLQIFGASIALGVIAGAAQITEGGSGYNSTGSQSFVNGASAGISQQAATILDRFIQIPPTITIREGHRVKVYFTQDMLLPAYTNHTIPQTF